MPDTVGRRPVASQLQTGNAHAGILGGDRVTGRCQRMAGWGREDTELALRCYRAGIRRLQLRHAAIAIHLHHPPRGSGDARTPNDEYLAESERSGRIRCDLGIDRHLQEFAASPADLRVQPGVHACA